MTERRPRRVVPLPVALAPSLLYGCATAKPPLKPVQLGTVGIVSAARAKVERGGPLPIPGAGAGAARGAIVTAAAMLDAAGKVAMGGPPGLVASLTMIVLAPLGAGVGAVIGAIGADSAEQVARADSTLRTAFARLDSATAVRAPLREAIRKHSLPTVVMVDSERVAGLTDLASLAEDGIDTILERYQITLSFTGSAPAELQVHPAHAFRLEIKTRLIRPYGLRLHEETFDVTKERRFVDWAARDGQALLGVTDRAIREFAEEIVTRSLRKPVLVDPALSN